MRPREGQTLTHSHIAHLWLLWGYSQLWLPLPGAPGFPPHPTCGVGVELGPPPTSAPPTLLAQRERKTPGKGWRPGSHVWN